MDEQQNIIIYRTADGKASVALYAKDGKIWLNQQQMAELFATSKPNISMHIANILKEKELSKFSVVKEFLTTAADGKNYNMGLTNWKGSIVRKGDVIIAKNYLQGDEIDSLNRLVDIFITSAEERVKGRKDLTLDYWRKNVDNLLTYQEKDILQGNGSISNAKAEDIVKGIYGTFKANQKKLDAQQADAEDIKMLENLEKSIIENSAAGDKM